MNVSVNIAMNPFGQMGKKLIKFDSDVCDVPRIKFWQTCNIVCEIDQNGTVVQADQLSQISHYYIDTTTLHEALHILNKQNLNSCL
jgi:hypothetical protein